MKTAALLAALLLVASPPARADGIPPDVVKQLEDPDPKVRSKGLRALRGKEDRASVAAAVRMLDDPDAYCRDYACWIVLRNLESDGAVATLLDRAAKLRTVQGRLAVADVLLEWKRAEAVPFLYRMTRDKDPVVRQTALDAIGASPLGEKEGDRMKDLAKLRGDRDPGVRAAALHTTLTRVRDTTYLPDIWDRALKDSSPGVRAAAAAAMPVRAEEVFRKRAAVLFEDDDWGVRVRAIHWGADVSPPPIPLIAARLEDERMLVADVAHDVLRSLSGLDLPPEKADWLEWWEKNRSGWKRPEKGLDGLGRPSVATYHGLPFRSESVLFVIDLSGSMSQPLKKGDDRPRLEVAREELAATLEKLPDGTLVDVMTFMLEPNRALGELKPLTASLRKKLMKWFDRQDHGRRGDLHEALEQALSDPVADTVLLLGDGATSSGEILFRERIQRRVRQLLRLRPVALHTVAFGGRDVDRKFMEKLAELSGGRSTSR